MKRNFKIKFTSFKVRFKKVLRVLKSVDPSKSANGIAPRFWKECAIELAPSTCKMFKYIVQKATYVSRWKVGRVSAPHKRGSVKLAKNYRPLQVLENISVYLEKKLHDQLYKWISQFIPKSQFGFLKGFLSAPKIMDASFCSK